MRYPFFALEGCDGSGKSTIGKLLTQLFRLRHIPCMTVGQHSWLDPWTTRLIVEVREQRRQHTAEAIAAAYLRDKHLHATATIEPARSNSLVLADRYILSDAVYQEVLYGTPASGTLKRHLESGTLFPTLIVYVEVSLETALRRIAQRGLPLRHYERPEDLARILTLYQRIIERPPSWLSPVVRFDNEGGEPEQRITEKLIPRLLEHIPAYR